MPGGFPSTLAGKCPRCGEGRLFRNILGLRDRCDRCGLSYDGLDQGDGPAVLAILVAGALVVGAALSVELNYEPPYWVHAALWLPLILVLSLGSLRLIKAWLIAETFRHKAGEGRQDP
jgi:uncharacterized protein (DUF983 family)